MTKSAIGAGKKIHDTAICNSCGETCTRHQAAVRGNGWNCLWCGFLTNAEVNSITNIADPRYSDDSPVQFSDMTE